MWSENTVGVGPCPGGFACPHGDGHTEGSSVVCDDLADSTIAIDAERLEQQGVPDAILPSPRLHRRDLLRDAAHPGDHQPPGQLGRGIRGRLLMTIGGDHDPEFGAGRDVDVGIDASLADQQEAGEPFQESSADLRALPDQDEGLSVVETIDKLFDVLGVVVPHRDVVVRQLGETVERPERVEVVVKDRDPHESVPPPAVKRTASHYRPAHSGAEGRGLRPNAGRAMHTSDRRGGPPVRAADAPPSR
jgi:hypothetical protein